MGAEREGALFTQLFAGFSPDRCMKAGKNVIENKPDPNLCRVQGKNTHESLHTICLEI